MSPAAPVPRAVTLLREVDLPADPGAPMPRVRLAPGVLTSLLFDAPVVGDSVRVEGPRGRVRVVDVGASSVHLEPLMELGDEGTVLRVRFADGGVPKEAALLLVGEPLQVDNRVRVRRPAPSVEQLTATIEQLRKRCSNPALADLMLRGVVQREDLARTSSVGGKPSADLSSNLARAQSVWSALVGSVNLVYARVENSSSEDTWRPDRATLTRAGDKGQLKVRALALLRPDVPPGERAPLVIEVEAPPPGAGGAYTLEVWDSSTGRKLVVEGIKLVAAEAPKASEGVKP